MEMKTQLARYEGCFDHLKEPSMIFTNSERGAMRCPRFWLYDYVQNVKTGEKAPALSYGVIVHSLLEEIVKEIQATDKIQTLEELNKIYNNRIDDLIFEQLENPDPQYVQDIKTNIKRSLEGWRREWTELLKDWIVIGVELDVSAPIKTLSGEHYRAEVPKVKIKGPDWSYMRPCRVGEMVQDEQGSVDLTLSENEIEILKKADSVELDNSEMPFFVAGRIDVLLRNRHNKRELAILDHKTTSSLAKYQKALPYDIQLPTYAYLIENGVNLGLGDLDGCRVTTCFFDLLHSKLPVFPSPLKSGKMSKRQSGPSWVFEEALDLNGLDRSDYEEQIKELEFNNKKYFKIVKRELLKGEIRRIEGELYSTAKTITQLRSVACNVKNNDTDGLDGAIPRQPYNCVVWGNCKYANNCLDNNLHYGTIEQEPKIKWLLNPQKIETTE